MYQYKVRRIGVTARGYSIHMGGDRMLCKDRIDYYLTLPTLLYNSPAVQLEMRGHVSMFNVL